MTWGLCCFSALLSLDRVTSNLRRRTLHPGGLILDAAVESRVLTLGYDYLNTDYLCRGASHTRGPRYSRWEFDDPGYNYGIGKTASTPGRVRKTGLAHSFWYNAAVLVLWTARLLMLHGRVR